MIYLIVSIVYSTAVVVLLKVTRKRKIDIHQVVAVNYIVVVILTMLVLKPDLGGPCVFLSTWRLFVALGMLLPSVFTIMGKSTDMAGIAKSDAAQRLSLFLSTVASFVLFDEKLTKGRLTGITLASVALSCLLWKSGGDKKSGGLMDNAALLLDVWSGYGAIDILFKQAVKNGTASSGNLLVTFSLVVVSMFGHLSYHSTKWIEESVIGGAVLDCLNFTNILTYIRAHQAMSENLTLVLVDMNIGVIVLGTLVGVATFKEKTSSINATGISVVACSVACLLYWPQLRSLAGL